MSKPHIHAKSSAKKFGGNWEDYVEIHEFMDSSKAVIADNRHRALTHNSWFISQVLPRVFGNTFVNSANKIISVRDVAEQHILEDFSNRFIPSAQDYLQSIEFEPWMDNGRGKNVPDSYKKIREKNIKTSD